MREPGVLDPSLESALESIAASETLLVALDFDGVIAPIVTHAADARALPGSAAALRRLAASPSVRLALVSGRSVSDLATVAEPPPGTILVGSHGAERGVVDEPGEVQAAPAELTPQQSRLLGAITDEIGTLVEDAGASGAWVEHKPAGVVVHTRAMPERSAADLEESVLQAVSGRGDVRALHGKRVVELSVVSATKGTAVTALRSELGADAVLFAGDDTTDEDALATLGPDDVGIKVGDGRTCARFRVHDPDAFAHLLARLAELTAAERA